MPSYQHPGRDPAQTGEPNWNGARPKTDTNDRGQGLFYQHSVPCLRTRLGWAFRNLELFRIFPDFIKPRSRRKVASLSSTRRGVDTATSRLPICLFDATRSKEATDLRFASGDMEADLAATRSSLGSALLSVSYVVRTISHPWADLEEDCNRTHSDSWAIN